MNEALISHDVARGRGSLSHALALSDCKWTIAAVSTDRLFFPHESYRLAEALPVSVKVDIIESDHGHDGFLVESRQLEAILAKALGVPVPERERAVDEEKSFQDIAALFGSPLETQKQN